LFLAVVAVLLGGVATRAEETKPAEPAAGTIRVTWQIRGLFCPEREGDLKTLFAEKLPDIRVVDVDMANSEATFEFDPAVAFGPHARNAKPEQLLFFFNGTLGRESRTTFTAHARRTTPLEKLCWLEIPFEGLDCKGCAWGVYRLLVNYKGVEQATADSRTGLATALIDPETFDEQSFRGTLRGRYLSATQFEVSSGVRREGRMDGAWRRWPAAPPGQVPATSASSAAANRQQESGQWVPPEFAAIPGGEYQRGDDTGDIPGTDRVVQTVTLGGYSMATTATTLSQWDAVRTWAAAHGYADLAEGAGRAADHPVHTVSWYDVVKWCNAASEHDGLKPCYTVNGTVYRTGVSDDVVCDWQADGYRLPTEAEWEVAARGGLQRKRFPWGDTISHDQANYIADPKLAYDTSGKTASHHPRFALVGVAGTSPVKTFPPNGYGLYDMTGNVSQWCWDWFGGYNVKPATDPKGPATGALRIVRGGHWNQSAFRAPCAFRLTAFSTLASTNVGLRLARTGSQPLVPSQGGPP
jgi:formylglycine-generating enzyme required for sulfatase activity